MKKSDVQKLIRIGSQMSNIMFNASQQSIPVFSDREREIMKKLQVEWDAELKRLAFGPMRSKSTMG